MKKKMRMLYKPINTLKKRGTNIWVVDGGTISFYLMPFTTRMTVIKLPENKLLVHSPTKLTAELKKELDALGQVTYILSPNKIHYWYIKDFQKAYPQAKVFASDNVQERAQKARRDIKWDYELKNLKTKYFPDIEIIALEGNSFMTEYTFFHHPSKTWIVTDIIQNFEANKISLLLKILTYLAGSQQPKGGTTRDQRMLFRGRHEHIRRAISRVKELSPKQIIKAHGKIIDEKVPEEIERIFSWIK